MGASAHELAVHPQARRIILVRERRVYATTERAEGLLAEARRHRLDRPERATRWASLAWMAGERVGGPEGAQVMALAAAEDANARRLLGQWRRAESLFRLAWSQLPTRGGPAELEILLLESSLAIQREQWVRAWDDLQRATELATALGDLAAMYRALSKRAIACKETGGYVEALELLRDARDMAPDGAERIRSLHNAVVVYCDAGWWRDGLRHSDSLQPHYAMLGSLWRARGDWLRGRLLGGADDWDRAARRLTRARMEIATHSRYWETAEVLCDEAEALLRAGRVERVRGLADVAVVAFQAIGLEGRADRAAGLLRVAGTAEGARAMLVLRQMLRARRIGAPPGASRG